MAQQINLNTFILLALGALLYWGLRQILIILKNARIFGTKIAPKELRDDLKGKIVDMLKDMAVVVSDVNDTIRMFNVGAELMFDFAESEVLGSPTTIIIPDKYKEAHKKGMEGMRKAGNSAILKNSVYELEGLHKSGKIFPIKLTLNQTRHVEGHQIETYYAAFIQDITEQKKKDEKTKLELELYKQGEKIAEIGTWFWDIRNNFIFCSENFNDLFDWRGGKADAQAFMERVSEKDRHILWETITSSIQACKDFEITYEVNARGYEDVEVFCRAKCAKDLQGFTEFLTGTIRVIKRIPKSNEKTNPGGSLG